MSAHDSPFPPRAPLIRVDGGLRARTRRGRIGEHWWSRRFIEVLESFQLEGRLARGRSYARRGQVIELRISAGEVTASVQGTHPTPYQVRIVLDAFGDQVWARVENALVEQAIYSARLLAGEMPPDIEEVFAAAGAPLFPRRRADLRMSCTCPDAVVPCKHLAATFYLLAEAFDEDPFRILHWRGRERGPLLARLRELRGGGTAPEPLPLDGESPAAPVAGAARALADVASRPLARDLDQFWLPPVPLPARPPVMAAEPDLLLRQLPAPGAGLGGSDLVVQLRDAYRRFGGEPERPQRE
jgi:uncharacterized Zn finger protein